MPEASSSIVIGYRIIDGEHNLIHGQPTDPFHLTPNDVLVYQAAEAAAEWCSENPPHRLEPVQSGDLQRFRMIHSVGSAAPPKELHVVCARCGSRNLTRDGLLRWNERHGLWEASEEFDTFNCESVECEGDETDVEKVPFATEAQMRASIAEAGFTLDRSAGQKATLSGKAFPSLVDAWLYARKHTTEHELPDTTIAPAELGLALVAALPEEFAVFDKADPSRLTIIGKNGERFHVAIAREP